MQEWGEEGGGRALIDCVLRKEREILTLKRGGETSNPGILVTSSCSVAFVWCPRGIEFG